MDFKRTDGLRGNTFDQSARLKSAQSGDTTSLYNQASPVRKSNSDRQPEIKRLSPARLLQTHHNKPNAPKPEQREETQRKTTESRQEVTIFIKRDPLSAATGLRTDGRTDCWVKQGLEPAPGRSSAPALIGWEVCRVGAVCGGAELLLESENRSSLF